MAKVFISHSWKDNDISRKIAFELKRDGAEIWIDYARIKGGDTLPERISQALDWCDSLILVWSKYAANSYWVKKEWQSALTLQKEIIPCIIDDTPLPAILCSVLYIDFKNFTEGYEQLLRAIDLQRVKPPSPTSTSQKIVRSKNQKVMKIAFIFIAILIFGFIGIYLINRTPSTSINKSLDEEKVTDQKLTEDTLKIHWEKRQLEMNTSYEQALQFDSNTRLPASFKAQTWQDFLNRYSVNNPNILTDDSLRAKANDRKIYWCNHATKDSLASEDKAKWVNWQKKMNDSYQRALQCDRNDNLSTNSKIQIWQDFLTSFAANNRYSQEDENLRSTALSRKKHWSEESPQVITSKPDTALIDMQLVFVSGDTFDMGDTFGVGHSDEKPIHSVIVSDFYISKTEVTVSQYRNFCQATGRQMPSAPGWGWHDNHPIVNVSWSDAVSYCKWVGTGCRLPTEAEWEYAAREGGKRIKWSGTNTESSLEEYAFYRKNSNNQTHPVATRGSNTLGVYDMSGNVWEWCKDWYDENYYRDSPVFNPDGPSSSPVKARVLRGGSWSLKDWFCRTTVRGRSNPEGKSEQIGFRIVQDAPK